MPTFTRTNGAVLPMEQVGRDIFFKNFAKTNITTAELDALVANIQATSTITAIGFGNASIVAVGTAPSTFTSGTTDEVNMIIEGADITSNILGAGSTFWVRDIQF